MKSVRFIVLPALIILGFIAFIIYDLHRPLSARGKSPAYPLDSGLTVEERLAQDIALSDAEVIDQTAGKRSEVFDIVPAGNFDGPDGICAVGDCRQVTIYSFDEETAIMVVVDLVSRQVVEVMDQPGVFPAVNRRLYDMAAQLIHDSDEVAVELGFHPDRSDIMPMPSSLAGTDCGYTHPCLAATFPAGDRFLWAHVDLTTETFAGIAWSPAPEDEGLSMVFAPSGCPAPGSIFRDGWQVDFGATASDGLRISEVRFNHSLVIASAKLAEWHVDYGNTGFIDATGCSGGGGQSYIAPFGETRVIDLLDGSSNVIGFELVQDFRMPLWGVNCNYRYEQHYQFFKDGRFRVIAGAYGRGCGTNAIYRPILRIDLAIAGAGNEVFSTWDGNDWAEQAIELKLQQAAPYTLDNYAWKVADTLLGFGFNIEPGLGQFGDGGRGDQAFVYITRHRASEGDGDMSALGACCNNDDRQGPDKFVNGETIAGEHLVLWYVPQMVTDATPGNEYCWTVSGGPDPETYPCFSGPMFHPFNIPEILEFWLPVLQR